MCNWVHCVCPGLWPFNPFFPVLFLFRLGGNFMVPIIWSVKTCALGLPRPFSPSVPAEAGRLLVCALPGHQSVQCIWFRAEPVSSYFSMACYSIVSYWCRWCMFIMLPCSQCALILVLEHVGNFGIRLLPGCSHRGVSVLCVFSQYVMLPLLDVNPLKYGSFVSVAVQISAQHNLFVSYQSIFLRKLVVYYGWHFEDADFISCRMFILLVEYGLVHRGDCINCETFHFCFDPAFVWPSLGHADSHSA